ncbi:hypothetical protein KAFR_0C02690 [Kazachstania africana CBS 2517]|uniref:Hyphally-regulated cell wall protein N-terminal domain-containing protein n=1 Tax=Kazachstania africana (strain ATCC 22294 / BCRC 22015 / CBS 2517 / CECT 1963 / NBRC 1671 / NRRL Y-8276) TaxID=1071382 RepID=H2ASB2_KAZAF|nr:hypothetical protein KAFR_0C02690 [Kazachstania africana CBS 2517]CCF57262.1 hypothetical protein KAFR_0C02690 [Kazachstania africana CBS 2517]
MLSLMTAALSLLPAASATTVSGRETARGTTTYSDTFTINLDSIMVIRSGLTHYWFGEAIVYGELCMYEDSWSAGWTTVFEDDIYNYGVIVIDDSYAWAGETFSANGGTFYNSGYFFVDGHNSGLGESNYKISAANTFNNDGGLISMQQASGSASVTLGDSYLRNTGTICLEYANWEQSATVTDTGCISINSGGQLTIDNLANDPVADQTIYLQNTTSILSIGGYSANTLLVRGFGSSNVISFPYGITSNTYNATSGIVAVATSGGTYYIDIGHYYNSTPLRMMIKV